jgi:hypothetical protein
MLEFSLKIYISLAYELIKRSLNDVILFDYGYKQIENFPLEKLLFHFSRLNKNSSLKNRLNKMKISRNYIAHRAMLERHEVIRDVLDLGNEQQTDMDSAEAEVNECLVLMARELDIITPHIDKPNA